MGSVSMNSWWRAKTSYASATFLPRRHFVFTCRKLSGSCNSPKSLITKIGTGCSAKLRVFASRDLVKKSKGQSKGRKNKAQELNRLADSSDSTSGDEDVPGSSKIFSVDTPDAQDSITIPSRTAVLQACIVTSGLISALGVIIRQVSRVASMEGLPIPDCSAEVSFSFEMWHLQLIMGLVILISSCRYLLLKTWPDFSESSEAANLQVLVPLEPLDYIVVAFLPGVSEELLFRGALLPIFGTTWKSALVVAALFGVLHLGNGRKYAFGIWATFVGLAYGYATIISSSIAVPMVAHAANNLVGGIIWSYTSKLSK